MSPPTLFFFLEMLLAIWGLLRSHMNVTVDFSISAKNIVEIFIRVALTLKFALGIVAIVTG